MINNLYCPDCKETFSNVTIRDGAVRCPIGDEVIFVFRHDGEEFTPKAFMALMDTRGVEAGRALRRYLQGNALRRTGAAGMMIAWIWPHLATTFAKDDVTDA